MSATAPLGRALVGRRRESETLDHLLEEVRDGRSRVLVLRGDAGVGKTALLRHVGDHALGFRTLRIAGVQSEMELAYAGLHQLCLPLLDGLELLPGPQRSALAAAFGLSESATTDPFLVGLATLGLLSQAAAKRPLLCLIDDVHWLDRASAEALGFVGRRLGTDSVGLVLTARPTERGTPLDDLPELSVTGLTDRDARSLLRSMLPGPLDDGVLRRLVAESGGNPLALLELPRGLSPEQLAGGFGLPDVAGLPSRIEKSFQRRLAGLPDATRQLLLLVAAEPRQDPVLIWRAGALVGIGPADAGPAVAEGLIDFGGEVTFSHPLVRSAVYSSSTAEAVRRVHRALAEATARTRDPDRRAWHLAHATSGLDEDVAAELESSADRAQARGGLAAAAAFWERAAALTPDPRRRAERALRAAQTKFQSGALERALELLSVVEDTTGDPLLAARVYLLRAQIASELERGHDASLLEAARHFEPLDPTMALETYRDAFYAALRAGRLAERDTIVEVAEAVRVSDSVASMSSEHQSAGLLDGLARLVLDGHLAAVPVLRPAVQAWQDSDLTAEGASRWLPLVTRMAHNIWDETRWDDLSARMISTTRERGDLRALPVGLISREMLHLFRGELEAASACADEAMAVLAATGNQMPPYWRSDIAAVRGRHRDLEGLFAAADAEATRRGEGQWLTNCGWSAAVLANGLGNYAEALEAAETASAYSGDLDLAHWALVELVEAAVRIGVPQRAAAAMRRIAEIADACGTDWALGTAAGCRALLTEGDAGEKDYQEAIERLGRTGLRFLLARAHLVYGEWLRRENRRVDAREHLTTAHEMLAGMGAEAFAERARRELAATGATVRRRSVETAFDLTDQEAQIARLAAEGQTNPEIAERLYISPRTVEWHLRNVYSKLGVSSRKHLRGVVAGDHHDSTSA